MSDKKYINGVFIKNHVFDNGGEILKVSIIADKLMEQLNPHKNPKGYVNLIIAPRRQPDDKGNTHYVYVDPFQPRRAAQRDDPFA